MKEPGMSVSEAAQLRGVRVDEIYRLIRSGRIGATKVKGKWRVYRLPALRRRDNG